jgi:mRNA-degrading endonuclease RelE of RelBE toxin-antitoxin system
MTSKNIKAEIQKSLDKLPEGILQDILDLLRQLENQQEDDATLVRHLRKIITEDKALLERLAK